jgi:hypothetical protein
MLFSDFYPMIDSWLMITDAPGSAKGPVAKHHRVYTEDYDLGSSNIKTPVLETLDWPAVPQTDPDYQAMEKKKQAAKTKGGGEEDSETAGLTDAQQVALAQDIYDRGETPVYKIPEQSSLLTYSHEWYRQRINKDSDSVETSEVETA